MVDYIGRVLDTVLNTYQPLLSAVELYGAKGVGKTETASQRAASMLRLDVAADVERLRADARILDDLPGPVLIDEWSRMPESWDMIRRAVDDGAPPGRFILTGSSTVPKGAVVHSGAGRIVRLRMRPLSLAERGIERVSVSLTDLLAGPTEVRGKTQIRLPDYVHEIVASGFPGIRSQPEGVRRLLLNSYVDDLALREFPEQGYPVRKPQVLRAWLTAYAAATATTTSYNRILEASTAGESQKPSKITTTTYRDVLAGLWVLDPLEAWLPTLNRLERLAQSPKHFLVDPGLACRLLNVGEQQLLQGNPPTGKGGILREGTLLGALFEHLSVLSVRVYAQASEAEIFHMRTQGGDHEIDMILQSQDGRILPVEVKLAQAVRDEDVRHILWLRSKLGSDCLDGMVLTTGEYAYRRSDGIAVVPLALLGP